MVENLSWNGVCLNGSNVLVVYFLVELVKVGVVVSVMSMRSVVLVKSWIVVGMLDFFERLGGW